MRRRPETRSAERGVTLIELLIAITLVAAISTGLLMAMSTSLGTYEKLNHRLEDNRRVMGMEQTVERQIGGVIPFAGSCNAGEGGTSVFKGDAQSLQFVSSVSLAEGARGYPRIVVYQVAQDQRGGVRLMLLENLYSGPASTAALCAGQAFTPGAPPAPPVELAGRLAYCRFFYQDIVPDSPAGGEWLSVWRKPNLPRAVRIEMAPLQPNPAELPFLTLNVPIHVTRDIAVPYADQ